jgi:hypothetical protein
VRVEAIHRADPIESGVGVPQYLIIPEAQNRVAVALKKCAARFI